MKGRRHTEETKKKISDSLRNFLKTNRIDKGAKSYDYKSEIDKGTQYYNDKIKIAEKLGYGSMHEAMKDMWENKCLTQTQIANTFKVSVSGVQYALKKAKTTKSGRRGCRNQRPNYQGIFIHTKSKHQFIAGRIHFSEKWEDIKYETIRCVECSEILSDNELVSRDEILEMMDSHREYCNYNNEKSKTSGIDYKNRRGILNNTGKYRVVAGYMKEDEYKLIRCTGCNKILSDNEWINYKDVVELIQTHKAHCKGTYGTKLY